MNSEYRRGVDKNKQHCDHNMFILLSPLNATTCDNNTSTSKNSLTYTPSTGSQTDVNWALTCNYFGTQDKLFSCLPKTGLKICHISINSLVPKASVTNAIRNAVRTIFRQ